MTKRSRIRDVFRFTDRVLLFLALGCSFFGLVLIFSAAKSMDGGSFRYILIQSIAIVLGLIGFFILSFLDLERLTPMWRLVFVLNILFQLSLIFFGYEGGGNKSWLRFGGIGIQPAELGKLMFIFTFAKHITKLRYELNRVRSLVQLGMHLLIVMAAIIIPSRDVGMSLPYVFIAVMMIFAAGLSLKWFAGGVIFGCAAVPILWIFLNDIQRDRILVLFDPSIAPDTYWQQQQSRIAIGSGRIFGSGYLKGMQTQNNMLPEKQTDFIFGVCGEEFGLIGCVAVVMALLLLILRVFYVSYHAPSMVSSLFCVGIGSMLLFQTFENIFMCLGIGPVMGLTLPFFSYGGSSIVTMYLALGIASGVFGRSRRQTVVGDLEVDNLSIQETNETHKIFRNKNAAAIILRYLLMDEKLPHRNVKIEWLPGQEKAYRTIKRRIRKARKTLLASLSGKKIVVRKIKKDSQSAKKEKNTEKSTVSKKKEQ